MYTAYRLWKYGVLAVNLKNIYMYNLKLFIWRNEERSVRISACGGIIVENFACGEGGRSCHYEFRGWLHIAYILT